jgi:uncharacterized protein YeaO (DUF488 family)
MPVKAVQLGTARLSGERLRLGTVRHLPRGVRKERYATENWFDVWLPNLAPSAALVRAAKSAVGDERAWKRFAAKYRAEMKRPEASHLLELVAAMSHVTAVSIGCYCDDPRFCHRSILIELLAEHGAEVGTTKPRRAR